MIVLWRQYLGMMQWICPKDCGFGCLSLLPFLLLASVRKLLMLLCLIDSPVDLWMWLELYQMNDNNGFYQINDMCRV